VGVNEHRQVEIGHVPDFFGRQGLRTRQVLAVAPKADAPSGNQKMVQSDSCSLSIVFVNYVTLVNELLSSIGQM